MRRRFKRLIERWQRPRGPADGAVHSTVLDTYVRKPPSAENAFAIFNGLWASRFPPPFDGVTAGHTPLFEDHRVIWALEQLGSVRGMRVLELGPLEGGHSYMLDRAGASQVLAIEGNSGAYLRCLVSKELLGMPSVHFECGDFMQYLRATNEQFDLCLASGVLYHMQQPVELLARIAAVAPRVLIWTHYYDGALLGRTRPSVVTRADPKSMEYAGFEHRVFRYEYGDALTFAGFCGGNQPFAYWLTRDDIIGALRHFGFSTIVVGPEQPEHPHGPAFTLLATKEPLT